MTESSDDLHWPCTAEQLICRSVHRPCIVSSLAHNALPNPDRRNVASTFISSVWTVEKPPTHAESNAERQTYASTEY